MYCKIVDDSKVYFYNPLIIDGMAVFNPTHEQLVSHGYAFEEVEPVEMSYSEKVASLIREKYSVDDELAIQRQNETKPEEYREYFNYCEECKRRAKEI